MLRRGLKTLDKLDAIKEAERLATKNPPRTNRSSSLNNPNPVDLAILEVLFSDFNPSDPF